MDPRPTAAMFTWLLAGLELLLFGCCTVSFFSASGLTGDEILRAFPPEQASQFEAHKDTLPQFAQAMAFATGLLGLLPALVLLIVGFMVRRGSISAMYLGLLLTAMQAIMVAVVLVLNVLGGLMQGALVAVTMNVLALGSAECLIILAIRWLWRSIEFHRSLLQGRVMSWPGQAAGMGVPTPLWPGEVGTMTPPWATPGSMHPPGAGSTPDRTDHRPQ